jgi:hypothetical protein
VRSFGLNNQQSDCISEQCSRPGTGSNKFSPYRLGFWMVVSQQWRAPLPTTTLFPDYDPLPHYYVGHVVGAGIRQDCRIPSIAFAGIRRFGLNNQQLAIGNQQLQILVYA